MSVDIPWEVNRVPDLDISDSSLLDEHTVYLSESDDMSLEVDVQGVFDDDGVETFYDIVNNTHIFSDKIKEEQRFWMITKVDIEHALNTFGFTSFDEPLGLFALSIMNMTYVIRSLNNPYNPNKYTEEACKFIININPYNAPCYGIYGNIMSMDDNVIDALKYYTIAINEYNDENAIEDRTYVLNHLLDSSVQNEFLDYILECQNLLEETVNSYNLFYSKTNNIDILCMLVPILYMRASDTNNYLIEFAQKYKLIIETNGISTFDHSDMYTNVEYIDFINFMNKVSIFDVYEKLSEQNTHPDINSCLSVMYNNKYIISYSNKKVLFTRLNVMEECGICYEKKINIDMQCGHLICTDCYKRVYNTQCPFCRYDFV